MKPSINAINIIKEFERCSLRAYKCLPTEELYTIGWGHYGVRKSLIITQAQADAYLIKDMEKAEKAVNKYANYYNFTQNQYDALISFAFNVGSIDQLTCDGFRSKEKIGIAILLYNKSKGKVVKGLVRRRNLESSLYFTK